ARPGHRRLDAAPRDRTRSRRQGARPSSRRVRELTMPVSISYIARETGTNLRRNIAMTIAAVLTVAVSLGLVGGALLMRQGVNKATLQWRGGIELSVFMNATATQGQIDAIDRELKSTPEVK